MGAGLLAAAAAAGALGRAGGAGASLCFPTGCLLENLCLGRTVHLCSCFQIHFRPSLFLFPCLCLVPSPSGSPRRRGVEAQQAPDHNLPVTFCWRKGTDPAPQEGTLTT